MMLPRMLQAEILRRLRDDNRIVMLFGPRQSGKTTLSQEVIALTGWRCLSLNGDNPEIVDRLTKPEASRLDGMVAGYEMLFLDEAQRIPDIGLTLKRIHDASPALKILVTGSSSLELAAGTREPLTGRTWTYTLLPIGFCELAVVENSFELDGRLKETLVLGSYPALFSIANRENRIRHLSEIAEAYLYRDILELGGIRNPRKLRDLLRLLAWQVGGEVSYQELAAKCSLSADTVISHIDLLEKSYVVFRLGGYSRNLRKEVTRKDKVYFYDNGIRNALIGNFSELEFRNDQSALWENFLVSERKKKLLYSGTRASQYFWRIHTGAELDYLEESDGVLSGYEFKWSKKKAAPPKSFMEAYPGSGFACVTKGDYLNFVS
ncbi:MAG: ATP-binding protein [Rectinemataceae bacterium]